MLKIEVDGGKGECGIELNGSSIGLLAEMHAAIKSFAETMIRNAVKNGGEKAVAMKMAEGFATAVRDAYKEVMEAKKNAD